MVALLTDPTSVLHLTLLLGFVGVTGLLMLLTVANRLRLRRVVRAWPTGRLGGCPVLPVLFLAGIVGLGVFSVVQGHVGHLELLLGYLAGGVCWLVAALVAGTVVVTDFGVVPHVNHVGRAVAWGQVVDYFRCEEGGRHRYVFFYTDAEGCRRRLELSVPPQNTAAFEAVVHTKLDARFEFYALQAYGKKALEGGT